MKKLGLIMLILIIAINTGCGPGKNITPTSNVNKVVESAVNSSNSDYAITKAEYADKEIKISYPQITKLIVGAATFALFIAYAILSPENEESKDTSITLLPRQPAVRRL